MTSMRDNNMDKLEGKTTRTRTRGQQKGQAQGDNNEDKHKGTVTRMSTRGQ